MRRRPPETYHAGGTCLEWLAKAQSSPSKHRTLDNWWIGQSGCPDGLAVGITRLRMGCPQIWRRTTRFPGDMFRQTKDLPEGTRVKVVVLR